MPFQIAKLPKGSARLRGITGGGPLPAQLSEALICQNLPTLPRS